MLIRRPVGFCLAGKHAHASNTRLECCTHDGDFAEHAVNHNHVMRSVSEGGWVIGKQPFLEWVSLTQENFLNEQKAAVSNNTKI